MHFHVTNLATNSVSLTDPLALACVMIQPPTSIIFSLQAYCQRNRGEFVGDFPNGYIDFVLDDFDKETKLSKRAIKLNNVPAAILGILALIVHQERVPLML